MDVLNSLASYGLIAVFVIMLLKEIGVPIPIPSDLIMITAGVQAAGGKFSLLALFAVVAIATFAGGSIQYFLMRAAGSRAIARFGRYVGLTQDRLAQASRLLEKRGTIAVVLGLNLPGARAGIIPAATLGGMTYRVLAPAMFAGGFLFYAWHMILGYVVGPSAATLLSNLNIPLLPVLLALGIVGLLGVIFVFRKRAAKQARIVDDVRAWSEAACPVCLAIALLDERAPEGNRQTA